MSTETIYALSSGKGRAGVSVIRLSGPETRAAVLKLTGRKVMPVSREAHLCWFRDPLTNVRLDHGLLLYFEGPKSFTGEDVAEFHIHGGRAVVGGFLDALAKVEGLRSALPGEFTRRAFDHGKMDLTAAEGLADLINAETEAQRRQALRLMEGSLATLYEGWRAEIIHAMAYLEADIDFADEEVPDDVAEQVAPIVEKLRAKIIDHMGDGFKGERIRDGLQVVILGEPNIGKSTLLNFLSRRDVAIVSDIAGTTRDVLEVHLDISGFPVTIVDTAGIRESGDVIEAEGIRRAESRAEKAGIKIIMVEAAAWPQMPERLSRRVDGDSIILLNKSDQAVLGDQIPKPYGLDCIAVLPVSAKQEEGTSEFLQLLSDEVEKRMELTDTPNLTRGRHREALYNCLEHLDRFRDGSGKELVLLAEDLRMAARSLGAITGRVDVEDILDVIFSEFCIGK
ncbi:tRNA uridine-5-carboxymethylaminomethyl(34) synthesis GTPase MnmE [Paremcibacter congregatus]|uniref:tRNA modification GTPase MnmE n=1 Tax=Paremcibacter congregatus TaxID=2043170 RepID=A0A2G4YPK7_9PROT|nr:tRNA uridine-5-carboxymethylaminomethyl(34) synthesis GTPase MnmE [Paremcibacter congregatus]PHZ84238.1 tRNA uridine-5-carboxymethylaminomethyl(34) synthesis GTPase MnmE [Paremcibacter congregatus]QDE29027.1 tRNA uridine-5-carboxymethylaminomethyl(34) synthesis GTPase MnmE [Paremcibacter congregatus]